MLHTYHLFTFLLKLSFRGATTAENNDPYKCTTGVANKETDKYIKLCQGFHKYTVYSLTDLVHPSSSPQNCPFPWGDLDPSSNTWFLGSSQVLNPNSISISSAPLIRLTILVLYKLLRMYVYVCRFCSGH